MPRCSASWRTSGAGSTTLPAASLYAIAGLRPAIVEIGVWNTTSTAVAVAVRRLTTAGTQGTGQSELCEENDGYTVLATAFDTHSSTGPTLTAGNIRAASLGGAVGSGVIWTFAKGLIIPAGTGNGIAIIPHTGTGQILDVSFTWDE